MNNKIYGESNGSSVADRSLKASSPRDETSLKASSPRDETSLKASSPRDETSLKAAKENIRNMIKDHGHVVIKTENLLTYTMGAPLGFNLAMSGVPNNAAQEILNTVVKALKGTDNLLDTMKNPSGELGMVLGGFLGEGHTMYALTLPRESEQTPNRHEAPMLQLVVSDGNRRFPWDPEYALTRQKLLWTEEGKLPSHEIGKHPLSSHLLVVGFNGPQGITSSSMTLGSSYAGVDDLVLDAERIKGIINVL